MAGSNPPPGMMIPPPFFPVPGPPIVGAIPPGAPKFLLPPGLESPWTEHRSPDERVYYYNRSTKQSTWEKPEELKSPAERIMAGCPWRESKTDSGRVYYYHAQTKQSVWTKPPELAEAERQVAALATVAASATTAAATSLPPKVPGETGDAKPEDPAAPTTYNSAPSAIEEAMKATLASIDLPQPPSMIGGISGGVDSASPGSILTPSGGGKQNLYSTNNQSDDDSTSDEDEDEREDGKGGGGGSVEHIQIPASAIPPPPKPQFKTRAEKAEGFRQMLHDRNVPANATWEIAVRLITPDPRYEVLKAFNEKKQIFNVYKTQKLKEEKEEQRLRTKKAKEDLEKVFLHHSKINSTLPYRKAEAILSSDPRWSVVSERDRRELYEDVIQELAKREKEDAKALRKRNTKVFNEILDTMPNLTYRTTWSEAQQMLLDNPRFAEDEDLQNMDKEDALICFENHIRMLEQDYEDEKERERRRLRRVQRKNREAFIVFLEEIHDKGKLTSLSLWKDLYIVISRDERFHAMLNQPGSTPLDLFKFYVESQKGKFQTEKKIVKEILKEKSFQVETNTSIDSFLRIVNLDERGRTLDAGNVRMSFSSLVEKAVAREREEQREQQRRQRRLEKNFKDMLRDTHPPVELTTPWDSVNERFGEKPEFQAITLESERMRVYKEYIVELEEREMRQSSEKRKKRKDRKRHKQGRSRSSSASGDEGSLISAPQQQVAQPTPSVAVETKKYHLSPPRRDVDESGDQGGAGEFQGGSGGHKRKHKKKDKKAKKEKKSKREKRKKKQRSGGRDGGAERGDLRDDGPSEGELSEDSRGGGGAGRKRTRGGGSTGVDSSEGDYSEGELQEKKQKLLAELHA